MLHVIVVFLICVSNQLLPASRDKSLKKRLLLDFLFSGFRLPRGEIGLGVPLPVHGVRTRKTQSFFVFFLHRIAGTLSDYTLYLCFLLFALVYCIFVYIWDWMCIITLVFIYSLHFAKHPMRSVYIWNRNLI